MPNPSDKPPLNDEEYLVNLIDGASDLLRNYSIVTIVEVLGRLLHEESCMGELQPPGSGNSLDFRHLGERAAWLALALRSLSHGLPPMTEEMLNPPDGDRHADLSYMFIDGNDEDGEDAADSDENEG